MKGGRGKRKEKARDSETNTFFKSFLCLLFIYGVYSVIENLD